ncbi:MAG TPA: NAD(P)/FAD-dependent oxidoreductase [Candidatus Angelobacter sp.]|jgi:flavin-dependent dehydrogenase|nr:NAD(P)/FAD-dependent oxidoreductase [Candidatus Angelobacter sp.]
MEQIVDVLVIGGGPGGSTAAAMLAKNGLKVLLLERDIFPRYHIGESLLASCQSTLKLSGAYDKVAAHGFTVKRGGVIYWGADKWVLDWNKMVDPDIWSWQVDRDTYDEILLRNAVAQGAEVVEGAAVKRIVFDGDRAIGAHWTRVKDESMINTVKCEYVIDASGRAGVLSQQHFKMRKQHEVFQNIAIWGYWTGAELLPDTPQGGINVVSSPEGWWWHIPLAGNRYSVGLVTHKNKFTQARQDYATLEKYYLDRLSNTEAMKMVTSGATFVGPVRAEQDYSYVSDRFCGPGYLLVGDAACFLDPLLSTGVHLAQYSAMLAAASIISATKGEVSESEAWAFFECVYRRAYTRMLVLVSRMYERYQGADNYFWNAQKLVHEKTRQVEPVRDFTAIIAGMTDIREAAHVDTRVLNESLISEAQEMQDASLAGSAPHDVTALDMKPLFSGWFALTGSDTEVNELYLITEPNLGLRKVSAATAN